MANLPNDLQGHTVGELTLIVRREKLQLLSELSALNRRIAAVHERLVEINKAELLLEGMTP
jgi:hypothetical protein